MTVRAARRIQVVWLCVIGGVVGAGGRYAVMRSTAPSPRVREVPAVYADTALGTAPRELVIFFGTELCSSCRIPGVSDRVRAIVDSLRGIAVARKIKFVSLGIALDGSPVDGLGWLTKFGQFDEVAIGGNWLNTAVLHYVWSDPATTPGVPQVLLLRQMITTSSSGIAVASDTVLHRWFGVQQIAPAAYAARMGHAPTP